MGLVLIVSEFDQWLQAIVFGALRRPLYLSRSNAIGRSRIAILLVLEPIGRFRAILASDVPATDHYLTVELV